MQTRVPRNFAVIDPPVIWQEDAEHGLVVLDGDRAGVGLWNRETGAVVPNAASGSADLLWEIDGGDLQPREAA